MSKKITDTFFYWSLLFLVVTLPMPKYSLNSLGLILFTVSWIFYCRWNYKYKNFKENLIPFLLLSSPFFLSIINGIFINSFDYKLIEKNIPFLLLPLTILTTVRDIKIFEYLLRIFSFSVLLALAIALIKAIFFKVYNLGSYFYYTEFSKVLDIHTTYIALFIIIAIFYFLNDIFKKQINKKWVNIVSLAFLMFSLYIVSSRISIVVLALSSLLFLIFDLSQITSVKQKIIVFSVIILLSFSFIVSPNFQKRNASSLSTSINIPDLSTRLIHWKAVMQSIKEGNLIMGDGRNKGLEKLYYEYKAIGFESGYRYKYNAHNQYLEHTIYYGLFGLLFLITTLVYLLFVAIKSKKTISIIIVLTFIIFMITESILVRQRGIFLFCLLASLICSTNTVKLKKYK
ncbi:O-antigen ligase family protein [Winogradskyella sp.]|uniref:O-antigen ligase family protein n=1 Tax=Winogradskyella sp. TaxID=1883156 RepID=UPI00262E213C|nr:O-antigen ligase family protein [Winogradskyella sp.]